jgi:hypothetical protein
MDVDSTGWVSRYLGPESGDEWVDFHYRSGHIPPGLRREPIPDDLGEFIEASLLSSRQDDWSGAAFYLSEVGVDVDNLAAILESRGEWLPPQALHRFGENLAIPDQRKIIDMSYSEVAESYKHFPKMCRRIASITKNA